MFTDRNLHGFPDPQYGNRCPQHYRSFPMRQLKLMLILLLLLTPELAFTQAAPSTSEKDVVIENIKAIIDTNYVFADQTESINGSLHDLFLAGRYDDVTDHKTFAEALSEDLVSITNNKHFLVTYNPKLIAHRRARRERINQEHQGGSEEEVQENDEEVIDWNRWYAVQENFGFEKLEILEGNIGYVKINLFQPIDWVRPTIDAAMGFVTNTNALIIDLINNGGGYSPTDAYLASYFFDEKPTLWSSSYDRPTDETDSVSTFQDVGGEQRYLNKPVFILVGENTFSLGEKFAYGMKHFDKATIVGQTSAGAAHAIDFLEVNDNYLIQIPVQYDIHPVTKTDWEGTGVVPDITTPENQALRAAHLNALDRLIEITTHEGIKERYNTIKAELSNTDTER